MARGVPNLDGPLSGIASDVRKLRGFITNLMQERVNDNSSVYFDPIPSELEVRRGRRRNHLLSLDYSISHTTTKHVFFFFFGYDSSIHNLNLTLTGCATAAIFRFFFHNDSSYRKARL